MWRLFIIIGLGGTMLVTSACGNDKGHRIPLRKTTGKVDGQTSERTDAINKAIESDKACLRVDLLLNEFVKQKDEAVLIYTYDLNMGMLRPTSDKADLIFEPQIDEPTRAHAFLKHPDEPLLEVVAAQNLQKSSKAFLLSPASIDEKCEVVSFENVVKAQFEVLPAGQRSNTLWLRNKADSREFIRYMYNRKDKLFITHYTPNPNAACGKRPPMLMRSYVVAREQGLNRIEIDRQFAKLIADNIDEPAELSGELTKAGRSSARVSLSYPSLELIHQILRDEKFVQPPCK